MSSLLRVVLLAFALACAALPPAQAAADDEAPERASGWTDRAPVTSRRFMVVAAHPLAVDAGYRILARGGTAVDAAIAVQLVLNVVEPQSSGIGGGSFLLYHDARTSQLHTYDGRETAPHAATPDLFLDTAGKPLGIRAAMLGGRSVGVPGTLALLYEAHRRHGKLPWADLLTDAIRLADEGFPVSPRLHHLIAAERYLVQPAIRAYLLDAEGKPPPIGAALRNPALAATLKRIAAEGPSAFYTGDVARDIVETVRTAAQSRGSLSLEDLAGYRVQVRDPVCGRYRSYRICGAPLPTSGTLTILQMLGILEHFDLPAMGPWTLWSVHFFTEAARLAYADRGVYMADPDFYRPPAGLLDARYLARRAEEIRATASMGRARPGHPPGDPAVKAALGEGTAFEWPSTSHVSIVDAAGNAVSLTSSIEDGFGSRLMTRSGFLLNNQLTDFSFLPVENGERMANRVQGGKRPRSSMAPIIVYDSAGKLHMIVGSPGGPAIINYVAKAIVAVLDWKLDPQAAAALPNVGSHNGPTYLESGTAAAALAPKLAAMGHPIRISPQTSGIHAIVRTRDGWIAGADPRREGIARGE